MYITICVESQLLLLLEEGKTMRKYLCCQCKEFCCFLCSCGMRVSLDKGIEKVLMNEEHVLAFLKNCVKGPFSKNSCMANFLTPRNQEQMDTLRPLVACVAVCGC